MHSRRRRYRALRVRLMATGVLAYMPPAFRYVIVVLKLMVLASVTIRQGSLNSRDRLVCSPHHRDVGQRLTSRQVRPRPANPCAA